MNIPPIPHFGQFEEDWVDWASKTYGVAPEVCRGMLAAYFTWRDVRFSPPARERLPPVVIGHAEDCPVADPSFIAYSESRQCQCDFMHRLREYLNMPIDEDKY